MRELEDTLLSRDREIAQLRDELEYFHQGEGRRREYENENSSRRTRQRHGFP